MAFDPKCMAILCKDCDRVIELNEEYTRQDKTGAAICIECAEYHWDVTMDVGSRDRDEWRHEAAEWQRLK